MQPIDVSVMYTMGADIHPLADIRHTSTYNDILYTLINAEQALDRLLHLSVFQLRTAYADGRALLEAVRALKDKGMGASDLKAQIDWGDGWKITSALSRFEAVLAAEMRIGSCYLVGQQKALDTAAVIFDGSSAFPSDLRLKVPASLPDTRDAMRCIVFQLATAAGFHLHRANESVLKVYYDAVASGAPPPELKTIGEYLKKLNELKVGDDRVKAALRDLNKLHRNPLIHPEQRLETVDEAYALYCSVFAAMEPMLRAIPAPSPVAPPSEAALPILNEPPA